ncbi:MAG TPA: LemA family protein [Phycisphaerae bacterium]|nr:LemA family protein [Phycisphaerae bacterium]HNU44075.1 LemA family protein [Phycisphaerae bacterium]
MKTLAKLLLAVFVALVLSIVLVSCGVYRGYTHAVALDEGVSGAWAKVESKLQRRFDLIDNLVETTKGLAEQEKAVFLGVAQARSAYAAAATVREKVQAAGAFESALVNLRATIENYPQLKSNEAFLKLMDSLEGSENRISVERDRYTEAVQALNTYVRGPWGRFCASLAGVEPAAHFKAAEGAQTAPKVDFADKKPGAEDEAKTPTP